MRAFLTFLLLTLTSPAWAQSRSPSEPVLLWGFQSGCHPLTDTTREVQAWVESTVTQPDARAYVLSPDSRLLGCQGDACATIVRKACPNAQGRILGGLVDQKTAKNIIRVRLWMHDLKTGQTAYHDNYCHNCDVVGTLKVNAEEIAQHPEFMSPPGTTPLYCRPDEPTKDVPDRSNRIYWVVYGKEQHKAAITATVRKVVQETGTEVPIEHEGKEYTVPVLKKILAKEPGAQVLGAEIKKDGIVEVFLYDGPTELIEVQKAECPGCDRDTLAEKVKQTTMLVLSHCFGESCARVGRSRAPAEACRPFEVPRCEGPDDSVALVPVASDAEGTPAGTVTGPEISPRMTRLTKGAVWGLFAASAATTAALLAANYTGAGRVSAPQGTTSDILLPAATATGILSVIALGVAIPTTIIVDRATHPPRPPTGSNDPAKTQAMGSLLLQCPN